MIHKIKSKIKTEHNLSLLSEYEGLEKLISIAFEDGAFHSLDLLNDLRDVLLMEFGERFIREYNKSNRVD